MKSLMCQNQYLFLFLSYVYAFSGAEQLRKQRTCLAQYGIEWFKAFNADCKCNKIRLFCVYNLPQVAVLNHLLQEREI